jgi:hypothetical protein
MSQGNFPLQLIYANKIFIYNIYNIAFIQFTIHWPKKIKIDF